MAIQRWDPLKDLVQLRDTMNRMFTDALARSSAGAGDSITATAWTPALDLLEEPGRYVLRADLPGVDSEDVEIKIEDGRLTLRGQRRSEEGAAREAYLRVERPRGPFTLQLALPPSIDAGHIEARQRNGVLEVLLPKRSADAPARIQIASA